MSGGKHTPGRVEMLIGYDGSISVAAAGPCRINLTTAGTPVIADVCRHADAEFFNGEANARRIVACWNACQTLTTEQVEFIAQDGGVRKLMDERDELAEALRMVQDAIYMDDSGALRLKNTFDESVIAAALSRATGSKS